MRLHIAGGIILLMTTGCAELEPLLDCREGDVAISQEVHTRWSDPNECGSHGDCTLTSTNVACPDDGAMFFGCDTVVHRDSVGAYTSLRREVAEDLCPHIDPGCWGGAICLALVPRCVEGVCMGVRENEIDSGTPDAGLADGGSPDAGPAADAGSPDAGLAGSGARDAG